MNKKDVLELKRRMNKDTCTFTRMCGCYIDADDNKVTKISETFLNLEDTELHKYLEITKKVLSGRIGNNILKLDIPEEERAAGGRQQFLMGLRESKLKNEELLDAFYDMIIDSYDYVGNFLILIFHDAYDVIKKTMDGDKLDESEEVYEYLLCAICPVNLTKPGLGYIEDDNRIGPRIRDWVVSTPDAGFIWPAFIERSADADAVMFYTANTKEPRWEVAERALGLEWKKTSDEKKVEFESLFGDIKDGMEEPWLELQKTMADIQQTYEVEHSDKLEPTPEVTAELLVNMLNDCGFAEDHIKSIEKEYQDKFKGAAVPKLAELIDNKAVKAAEVQQLQRDMKERIAVYKELLERSAAELENIYNRETELSEQIRAAVKE